MATQDTCNVSRRIAMSMGWIPSNGFTLACHCNGSRVLTLFGLWQDSSALCWLFDQLMQSLPICLLTLHRTVPTEMGYYALPGPDPFHEMRPIFWAFCVAPPLRRYSRTHALWGFVPDLPPTPPAYSATPQHRWRIHLLSWRSGYTDCPFPLWRGVFRRAATLKLRVHRRGKVAYPR